MFIKLSLLCFLAYVSCQEGNGTNQNDIGWTQAVAVSGKLTCNGKAASNIKLKLYENEIIIDHLMAEGHSDSNGEFKVSGSKSEITTIDPKLNVYHKCNYNGLCYKKFTIKIPKDYVNKGKEAERTYDVGTLNLANKYPGESTDCIN
ncbi:hypothetical protein CRE_08800 [Caenorhabditis remanei]|uniref:Uncharacterized protein n=2 Tax=Caenorhabditis remanei TaxID=31234 RepID=E3LHL0_CAERE|nr:hypothetical protein CRE_08800 [Caenorhabditis remanei]